MKHKLTYTQLNRTIKLVIG